MSSDTPVPDTLTTLPLNAMITHVPVNNERGTNLTNLTSLEVENAKGGLGPSPFTQENKSQNELVYLHITNVLLDGNNNTQISIAIRESAPTLPVLLEYIRTPGLIIGLRWKDKDDGNKEKKLTEEQYEDLLALYSFLNYYQNYGPIDDGLFDILKTTREQFEHFISMSFRACTPILYNQDEALKHQQWRLKLDHRDNIPRHKTIPPWELKRHRHNIVPQHKTDTAQVCDGSNNLWCRYFNPINRGHIATAQGIRHATEFYILSYYELYWDEIIWPPLLRHEGYTLDDIKRALSGQVHSVYSNSPPEYSLTIASKNKGSQTELVTDDNITTPSNVKDRGDNNNNNNNNSGLNGTNGGEVIEGGINIVGGKGEEVKLFGGGRSDPDIRSGDGGLESSDTNISGAEDDIATKIAAANKCGNSKDPDLDIIRKVMRREEKSTRRDIAWRFTGSRRLYHKAVPKIQPSVVIIQSYARMFFARRKVISMRGGVYRRIRANGIKREFATSPVHSYTMSGTRRIHSQASELFQSSSLVTLLEKNDGYNGEMGDAWNSVDPNISFNANVFAIHMSNQGPLPFPKALTWGEESGCTLYVRLGGEYVEKVNVDRGAWGEYDDNPIGVRDWKHTLTNVWRFTGVFTVYGGMTFDVFNPKTGMVLYLLDVRTISDELRVILQPKVNYHDDNDDSLPDPRWMVEMTRTSTKTHDPQVTLPHVYRLGESTNLICFAMSNDSLIKTANHSLSKIAIY